MSVCPACNGIIGRDCWNPQECQQIADDMQSTTPARAEAQDEGAALRIERWIANGMPDTSDHTPHSARLKQDLQAVIAAARAHPSPTPAAADADADRVRIAVEAFLKAEDEARDRLREAGTPLPSTPEVDALREALAALKSEGK